MRKLRFSTGGEKGSMNVANIMMLGIAMIFIAVGFIIYPVILEGTDSILDTTRATSDSENVTTALGVTSGNITLSETLFDSDVANVISITSSIVETPAASTYTLGTGRLLMTSLTANVTDGRIITATYYYGNVDEYTGLRSITEVTPLIVLIGFVTAGVITGFFGVKNIMAG